jgi:hypothetical protein
MTEELCGAEGCHDGTEVWCDMRKGHDTSGDEGQRLHVDTFEGWEWL